VIADHTPDGLGKYYYKGINGKHRTYSCVRKTLGLQEYNDERVIGGKSTTEYELHQG